MATYKLPVWCATWSWKQVKVGDILLEPNGTEDSNLTALNGGYGEMVNGNLIVTRFNSLNSKWEHIEFTPEEIKQIIKVATRTPTE
jgi:hypothetical protein